MNAPGPKMSLRVLLDEPKAPALEISGLSDDSRDIRPGDAFVAVAGAAADGHEHAAAAVARGAVGVLAERPLPPLPAPVVQVPELRKRRGVLAAKFYAAPSRKMVCVGVTGTNGKTTIAYQLAGLAAKLGRPAAYLGTLGWGELDALAPSRLTTESAVRTQKRLACLHRRGRRWAALEVSSHALAQERADEVAFDYAVFSNLSRDHLDYHGSLAAYGAAKRRLFEFPSLRGAVINIGDDFGRRLARSLPGLQVLTYGGPAADLHWEQVAHLRQGVRARLQSPWGSAELVAPVCGDFGLANLGAAIGVLALDGLPFADLAAAAAAAPSVPGRMEFFRQPGFPTLVVDYAHSPDALAKALEAVRRHCSGRLICVVGCGGERDVGKRPMMARAAAELADLVWLTSDNPRREDPGKIIADMAAGLADAAAALQEVDRGAAIAAAVEGAEPEDLVLVAGKGHEDHQEVAGRRLPFSDRRFVRELLGVPKERC